MNEGSKALIRDAVGMHVEVVIKEHARHLTKCSGLSSEFQLIVHDECRRCFFLMFWKRYCG